MCKDIYRRQERSRGSPSLWIVGQTARRRVKNTSYPGGRSRSGRGTEKYISISQKEKARNGILSALLSAPFSSAVGAWGAWFPSHQLLSASGARVDLPQAVGGRAQLNREIPHLNVITEQPVFTKQVVDGKALTTILQVSTLAKTQSA